MISYIAKLYLKIVIILTILGFIYMTLVDPTFRLCLLFGISIFAAIWLSETKDIK